MKEKLIAYLESIKIWAEPQPGAGDGLGPLAGVGMYMQYDCDREKHTKEIQKAIDILNEV